MPVATTAALEVRVLFHDDAGGSLLLVRRPDQPGYVLPGGRVDPAAGVEGALARQVAIWLGRTDGPRAFVGCVETGGGAAAHELAVVFAVPARAAGSVGRLVSGLVAGPLGRLVAVGAGELAGADIRPAWLRPAITRWVDEEWPFWRGVGVRSPEPRWTHLRQSVAAVRAQLRARHGDLVGPAFRDASVAICALVAAADGRIDATERDEMLAFVTTDEVLAAFPPAELERLFDTHVDRLRADPAAGRAFALREIAKVAGRPVEARAVVQLGAVIGRADGSYDEVERAAVADAIEVLGLDRSAVAVQEAAG